MIQVSSFRLILLTLLALPALALGQKVACFGDSITEGFMAAPYPTKLAEFLGEGWDVQNFGAGGATVTPDDENSYRDKNIYTDGLNSNAQHVIIKLGTNDGISDRWISRDFFKTEYRKIIDAAAAMPSAPQIWLVTPVPVINDGDFGVEPDLVNKEIVASIKDLNGYKDARVIQLHSQFRWDGTLHLDDIHPTSNGAARLASVIASQLRSDGPGNPKLVGESSDLGGGWRRISGLGDFSTATYPWIFHEDMKWVYVGKGEPNNLWVWTPGKSFGWLWTNKDLYPDFYRDETESFYFYFADGDDAFVFDYKDDKWEDSPF